MTIRTFIFCDTCNGHGIRNVEFRRSLERGDREGRRVTDARSWFEGPLATAMQEHGWTVTGDGRHICPYCRDKR